jgi:hypothetical protein
MPDLIAEATYGRHPARLQVGVVSCGVNGYLELPRPCRLMLTAGWNLTESIGLPIAGYLVGATLGGQGIGMVTGTAVVWLTMAIRWLATRTVPGLVMISGLVLTLQTLLVVATGNELVFLLQFPVANLALCVLFARTARTGKPLVADLAAEMVALRLPAAGNSGLERFFRGATWLWAGIFAASAVGLAALVTVEPANVFLALTTAVTVGGAVAGAVFCALWFMKVLRGSGLRLRFSQAPAPGV